MFTEKDKLLLERAILQWGKDAQRKQCIEECSELITAILHRERNKCDDEAVVTEIADVAIMCEQMKIIYGAQRVENEIRRKIDRIEKRLENEHTTNEKAHRGRLD